MKREWKQFLFCTFLYIFPITSRVLFSFGFFILFSTGAIFSEEQKDTSIELAFKYAVYKINKDRSILPKTTLVRTQNSNSL